MKITFSKLYVKKNGYAQFGMIEQASSFVKDDDYTHPKTKETSPVILFQTANGARYMKFRTQEQRNNVFAILKANQMLSSIYFGPEFFLTKRFEDEMAFQILESKGVRKNLNWAVSVLKKDYEINLHKTDFSRVFSNPTIVMENTEQSAGHLLVPTPDPSEYIAQLWTMTLPVERSILELGITPLQYFKFKVKV